MFKTGKVRLGGKFWIIVRVMWIVWCLVWLTLEGVAAKGNWVHHCSVDPRNRDYSELFSLMITPGPRHSPFLCPIFVVLFCKLKHKTGILRARNNSVSQWCGAAEDWSVFRCISRRRAQQRALHSGSANESAAGRVPSQSQASLVASMD